VQQTYFQKGFGLKGEVGPLLVQSYHSPVVARLKSLGFEAAAGTIRLKLAREFGFCYGVDRAVEYAYEARTRFPDRRIFLSGEIIHNPDVNARLKSMAITILPEVKDPNERYAAVDSADVVILPAFGVTVADMELLTRKGCVLVDTTCGSVLNVWKMVHRYAGEGFTVIIHGKHYHEETRATASQVKRHPGGKYLTVYNMAEARLVCDHIEHGGGTNALVATLGHAASDGFDFDHDLVRVGVANQTTMLSGESLAIAGEFRKSLAQRYGDDHVQEHFRAFDTICSATQERQDAVVKMLAEPVDVMLVVGGYNSSNTCALAALAERHGVRTYHIEDAGNIHADDRSIRYQPVGSKQEVVEEDWLRNAAVIGVTAGASTPNNKIGETVARVCDTAGVSMDK
jgi:4-hydroxy-3-methylbut-2-enyl diphosphate reductase